MERFNPEIPPPVREVFDKLNQAISENAELKGSIFNTLERYINDSLWPSSFRELEKALDRLAPELSKMLKACLIFSVELFDSWREQLPEELAVFLKDLQEFYAYKYRVGAFKTVLSSDAYSWYTVNVQKFLKNNLPWYGISIVRNDGKHVYFEGNEDSINRMIEVIKGVMQREETKFEEV